MIVYVIYHSNNLIINGIFLTMHHKYLELTQIHKTILYINFLVVVAQSKILQFF